MKRLTVSLLLFIGFVFSCSLGIENQNPLAANGSIESIPDADAVVAAAQVAPLSVIDFNQNDALWGAENLGTTSLKLRDQGCAVTSLAMVYAYAGGVISNAKGVGMDPSILNAALGKYANSLEWTYYEVLPSGLGTLGCQNWNTNYTSMSQMSSGHLNAIINELNAGRPVIAWVISSKQPIHFVVITGSTGSNFNINDPDSTNGSGTLFAGTRPYTLRGIRTFRPAHPTVMIDDTTSDFWITGAYTTIRSKTVPRLGYGAQMRHSTSLAGGTSTVSASWRATLPATGVWNLYVWVPRAYASTKKAVYEIGYGTYGGANWTKVSIQQLPYFDQWVQVGTGFSYLAGTAVYVKLNNITGTAGEVIAYDAIKWSLN